MTKIHLSLQAYTQDWDNQYVDSISTILLFSQKEFSIDQQQKFVRYFYHARGHYYKFLWFLGSLQTDQRCKDLILENIREEFGYRSKAHEKHYMDFAQSLEVDLEEEIIKEKSYDARIRKFNQEHLKYILSQKTYNTWSAFCAYERLDNVDYTNLAQVTSRFGLAAKDLIFFSVHQHAQHFSPIRPILEEIWNSNPDSVIDGFEFIATNQIQMWQDLSDLVLS